MWINIPRQTGSVHWKTLVFPESGGSGTSLLWNLPHFSSHPVLPRVCNHKIRGTIKVLSVYQLGTVHSCGNVRPRESPCTRRQGHTELHPWGTLLGPWLGPSCKSLQSISDKVYLYHFNDRWSLSAQC